MKKPLLAFVGAAALAVTGIYAATGPAPAPAQERIPIFDAHLHYNWEPTPFYPVEKALEVFRRNGVSGVLANSRPNTGTHALVEAKPKNVWVVPFIRPNRTRADIGTWYNDPASLDLIVAEHKRGYYRGIGEFHIYGKSASAEVAGKIVRFAVQNDLYLHCHCDDEALELLFVHDRRAKIIWAHTGFSTTPARIKELLDLYPAMWGELSYRSGITDAGGKLTPEWKELFARYSERFLLGSDTWINERWFSYDTLMNEFRGWLVQLPPDQARRIAYANAERLFGPKKVD